MYDKDIKKIIERLSRLSNRQNALVLELHDRLTDHGIEEFLSSQPPAPEDGAEEAPRNYDLP